MKRIEKKKKDKLGQSRHGGKKSVGALWHPRQLRTCRRAENESRVRWAGCWDCNGGWRGGEQTMQPSRQRDQQNHKHRDLESESRRKPTSHVAGREVHLKR